MSNTYKDGGPAFPKTVDGSRDQQDGMSLRDYFAGQALVGFITDTVIATVAKEKGREFPEFLASCCYQAADAMLAKREEKKK